MRKQLQIAGLIILLNLNIQCQNRQTAKPIDLSQATIKVDSCGLSYKGKPLELGVPLKEWEKILGSYDRNTDLGKTWDKLGIMVGDWQNREGVVDEIHIFFLNLESPEAKKQELTHARDWLNYKERFKPEYIKENEERLKEKFSPKNYIYPFTTYQGYVNLHGGPVKKDMKVEEINAYRKDLPFSGKFGYVDQDIDGINDSGVTDQTFGGDYRAPGTVCKDGRLQYYELTFTRGGSLEYLKIARESKEDYEGRLLMEENWKKREKEDEEQQRLKQVRKQKQ